MDARTTDGPPHAGAGTGAPMLVGFLAAAFAAGALGAVAQGSDVGARYLALELPVWAPPAWLFGPVWSVLYTLIGVAAWRLHRTVGRLRAAPLAFGLWSAQLAVNAVWPGVFFGLERFGPAVGVIVVLDVLVAATMVAFWRHDRLAAALLGPYLAWIGFATALNLAIWQLS